MSITKRSRNVYRFATDLPPDPVTGKRQQLTTTFRGTAAEAKVAHAEWLIEVKGAAAADGATTALTFGEVMARYLKHMEGRLSPRTLDNRQRDVRLHLNPTLGGIPLKDLRSSHLDALYDALTKHLDPSTIQNVHNTARCALKQAVKWEWINRNVAATATPPPVHKKEPYSPPEEQVYALLDHLRDNDLPLYVFTELVASTGMRPGEACALRWQDVDLDTGRILVSGSISRIGREHKETKTYTGRVLHVDSETAALLEKWHVETNMPPAHKYLFSNEVSHTMPWRPDTISLRQKRHRDRLGMTVPVTYRGLRHFVATHLIANGVDIVTVSKRLGHKNPAMTLNVYSSAVPKNDKAAAELLRAMRKVEDDDGIG